MNKILEGIKSFRDKWLGLSTNKKIVSIVLTLAVLSAAIYFGISSTQTKYGVLFSQMDSTDSASVITKLKSDKVAYKVDSSTNTIYVPQDKVDDLRLEYASVVKNGSVGFELFDNTSQFGMTDKQFSVQYNRALEGELERTIKSFPQVDNARVQLVIPEDSVFVQDQNPSKASVFLKMKPGQTLSKDQVKAIVSLISGGVKNLSKENVQVVDDNMKLLSENIESSSDSSGTDISETTAEKNKLQTDTENALAKKVLSQLEPVFGDGKVKVQVHADMNFDAVTQKSTVEKDPVVVSEHTIKDVNPNGTTTTSSSPVDNNVNSNQIVNGTAAANSTHDEVTRNYDTSKVETNTTVSPGSVKRMTVSVVLDGNVNQQTQASVNNIVTQAVGLDAQRGDTLSIEGLKFDTSLQNSAQKAIDQMNQEAQQKQRNQMILAAVIGGIVLLAFIIGLILFRKKKKKNAEEVIEEGQNIDAVISDDTEELIKPKAAAFDPIDFDSETESNHIEKEIRKYASTKPEQVADVVKAWLNEDER